MSGAALTISIVMPAGLGRHALTANCISIMNIPNQTARQVILYDHGLSHWSQGGPLFYDRRVPPPPLQMGSYSNPQLAGPSPQWMRPPGLGHDHPHFAGRGAMSWGNQNNCHNRNNSNRHHQGRNATVGGGGQRNNNRVLAINFNNNQQQNTDQETRYLCFKCGDYLQNSPESGIHLCDAGEHNLEHLRQQCNNNGNGEDLQQQISEDLHAKLKMFLEESEVAVSSDVKLTQEEIHKVCLERIEKFISAYSQLQNEQRLLQQQQATLEAEKRALEQRQGDLTVLQTCLEDDRNRMIQECKKEEEEIARRWQELKDEILRMEEVHVMQKGRIRLDVGGVVFTTSRLTLTREADSMLAAMFSGRHHVAQEEDGTVFIDRDGTHFRYILNYLRDGGVSQDGLPRDRQVLRELRNEAVYFQLNGLVQTIEKFL